MTAEARRISGAVLVTTSSVPHHPASRVIESGLAWGLVEPSVPDAIASLHGWATENGWDAIVGLRLQAISNTSGELAQGWGEFKSTSGFVAYGTAIRYTDTEPPVPPRDENGLETPVL